MPNKSSYTKQKAHLLGELFVLTNFYVLKA